MSRVVPVFVNGVRVEVEESATAVEAVRVWRAEAGEQVSAGSHLVTDSRGLPIDPATPVFAGAIFRLVPVRGRELEPAPELFPDVT